MDKYHEFHEFSIFLEHGLLAWWIFHGWKHIKKNNSCPHKVIFIPWSKNNTKKSQRCHLKHIYLTEVGDDAPTMEIGHPKDHWTLKPGYFEDPTPAIQVQTLW